MPNRTKILFIAIIAAFALAAGLFSAFHHRQQEAATTPPTPPALLDPALQPGDITPRLLTLSVNLPDPRMQPPKGVTCATTTGIVIARCTLAFKDTDGQPHTDQLTIYVLANDGDYPTLQSQLTPTPPSTTETAIIKNVTLQTVGAIPIACAQTTAALCLAHYAPGIAITASALPDIQRALALEKQGLLALYQALGVP